MKNFILNSRCLLLLLFLFITVCINAQTKEWTWIKGRTTAYQFGVYGVKGVPSETSKPGGRQQFVSWTDANGNFWLFGGIGYASTKYSGFLNDLWKFDNSLKQWVWINGDSTDNTSAIYGSKGKASALNNPGGRSDCMAWTDDSGNLWLFGGYKATHSFPQQYLNDLWKYNIANNKWTWINGDSIPNKKGIYGTQGIPSGNNKPGARRASITWRDTSGNFWLFGGQDSTNLNEFYFLSDLWKYNISSNTWTWVKGDSNIINQNGVYGAQGIASDKNKPGARTGGSGWTDDFGNLWLFGGYGLDAKRASNILNDLWKFNIKRKKWTWIKGDSTVGSVGIYGTLGVAADSNKPGAMQFSFSWKDTSGNLWLFGGAGHGKNLKDGFLNDLWKYNIQHNRWTWVKGDDVTNHSGVYGEQRVASKTNKPGSRYGGVTWIDVAGNFWMFGGWGLARASQGYLNDLWLFTLYPKDAIPSVKNSTDDINSATSTTKLNAVIQPNPSTSMFVLNVQPVNNEAITITIYNTAGSVMQQLKVQPHQQISFGEKLPSGSYFIEIKQGSLRTTLTGVKRNLQTVLQLELC